MGSIISTANDVVFLSMHSVVCGTIDFTFSTQFLAVHLAIFTCGYTMLFSVHPIVEVLVGRLFLFRLRQWLAPKQKPPGGWPFLARKRHVSHQGT